MKRKMLIVSRAIIILTVATVFSVACGRSDYRGGNYSSGYGKESAKESDTLQESNEITETAKSVEELIAEAQELSLIEEEDMTSSGGLTNAILEATQIVVLEDNGNSCKVQITYPNVKDTFVEMSSELPEPLEEAAVDAFYKSLEEKVADGELPMLEVTLEVPVGVTGGGQKYIQWTNEAQSAMTGGLYDIYYEAMSEE